MFLEELYSIANEEDALDFVYDTLMSYLKDCKPELVDEVLANVDLSKITPTLICGILTVSSWCKHRLKNRDAFYNECVAHLGEEQSKELLVGLK